MRMLVIVKNDIKMFLKDWMAVVLFLGLPIAFVAIFISALAPLLDRNRFLDNHRVGIVDKDDTFESRVLINRFLHGEGRDEYSLAEDGENFITFIKVSEDQALFMLEEDEISGVIIVPPEFVYMMSIGENIPLKIITGPKNPLFNQVFINYMQSYANMISAAQNSIMTAYVYYDKFVSGQEFYGEKYTDAITLFTLKALARSSIFTSREVSYIPDVTEYEYFTAALLVVFIMFSGIMGIKFTAGEKFYGITTRLNTTPITNWEFVLARFMTVFILSLFQFAAMIIPAALFFNIYLKTNFFYLMVVFTATVFCVSGCAIFVAALSSSPSAADLAGSLGTLLMAAVGGSIYPLTSLPDPVKIISLFTINRWSVNGFLELFSGKISMGFYLDIAILFVMGLVYIGISILLFKKKRRI